MTRPTIRSRNPAHSDVAPVSLSRLAAPMTAIEQALLALMAAAGGDADDCPRTHRPRPAPRPRSARRERQIVQIAALVIAGRRERAEGLSREHSVEFPGDTELLAHVSGQPSQRPLRAQTKESR